MPTNNANVIAKIRANYQCQECGRAELVQAHHEIPKDDNSIVVLCAKCHSKRHPEMAKRLFSLKGHQPYWSNISASSLGRKFGVHSRTIIRTSRRLGITNGYLTKEGEKFLKINLTKFKSLAKKARMLKERNARLIAKQKETREPIVIKAEIVDYLTIAQTASILSISRVHVWRLTKKKILTKVYLGNRPYYSKKEVLKLSKQDRS